MKSKIGFTIIIISFILALNPYFLIFTVPLFLIGVVIVWISEKRTRIKLFWTIIPTAIWYPTMILFFWLSGIIGTATAQKIDFIFKEGFIGQVTIVDKMACGQKKILKNNREQLYIPENGICLYQEELKNGYINHKYYYENIDRGLVEIPERDNSMFWESEKKQPSKNTVGAWLGGTGSKTNNEISPKIEYSFIYLTINSKNKMDSLDEKESWVKSQQFEKQIDSLVRICKTKQKK
ncbi:MAG: hypothetical protein U0V72_05120 [Cytophagales bacterium]